MQNAQDANPPLATPTEALSCRRAVPDDGMQYFFGYYEKCPWSPDGARLLAGRAAFRDRRPGPDDALEVGWLEADGGPSPTFHRLAATTAWNWQQGCMLRWFGGDAVLLNDRSDGQGKARIVGLDGRERLTLDWPVYELDADARSAWSLDFARLFRLRPGYGYPALDTEHTRELAPDCDGVSQIDLQNGRRTLRVSLKDLAEGVKHRSKSDDTHWVNHIQASRTGRRVAFLHRWGTPGRGAWWTTRLMVMDRDGGEPRALIDHGMVSHYDWLDDEQVLAWCNDAQGRAGYFIFSTSSHGARPIGARHFSGDGHCSFSPDGQWVLTDTYPDENGYRTLMLYHPLRDELQVLGRFFSPSPSDIEIRCDLHPRWNRTGSQVCIDHFDTNLRRIMSIVDLPLPPRDLWFSCYERIEGG